MEWQGEQPGTTRVKTRRGLYPFRRGLAVSWTVDVQWPGRAGKVRLRPGRGPTRSRNSGSSVSTTSHVNIPRDPPVLLNQIPLF